MIVFEKDFFLDEIDYICDNLIKLFDKNNIVAFYGDMGAGKTTLIAKLVEKMNGQTASSPTFSLVNVYSGNPTINHFDCYRLDNEKDIESIGFEEYFYEGNYCFIEWPEKIETLIPENGIKVYISILAEQNRRKIIVKT